MTSKVIDGDDKSFYFNAGKCGTTNDAAEDDDNDFVEFKAFLTSDFDTTAGTVLTHVSPVTVVTR